MERLRSQSTLRMLNQSMRIQAAQLGIAFALIISGCSKTPEDKLIGEWKGTDFRGQTASLSLNRDRTLRIGIGNLVLDEATMSSGGAKAEWRVNFAREPISLDVVITPKSGQQIVVPMIIRFITDQKLQLRIDPDMKSRPIGFSADDPQNQLVLVKQ